MSTASVRPVRIMFVCLGNICRSPLAHGVFEHLIRARALVGQFEVASSGTGAWHLGQLPDRRMRSTASKHGVQLDHIRAQEFTPDDLQTYDHIYAMDQGNLYNILSFDHGAQHRDKVTLFRTHDPVGASLDVPDPYYSGRFDEVYAIVSRTCEAILEHLVAAESISART